MIASATEIVCALGCEANLVARSHECDWPVSVNRLPVCTSPRFDVGGSSGEIDVRVKALASESASLYRVDGAMLRELRPDVIITQAQCAVCAVSEKDVLVALSEHEALAKGVHAFPSGSDRFPKIVSLSPNNLADVWQCIRNVADALGVVSRGDALIASLQRRVDAIARTVNSLPKPTVACLEWLDPLMAAGNWVPELVTLAGGENLFGVAGKHSPWMTWDELCVRDPDVIVAMPCGFDLARTCSEMAVLKAHPAWRKLNAVRNNRVFAVDGNQFFNRPGPRLVESVEILSEIFHPAVFHYGYEGTGWKIGACV